MGYAIGVWGPSAAGKTAYLSQLYFHADRSSWTVFPMADADRFLDAARQKMDDNHFPLATVIGAADVISYGLRSAEGIEYSLTLCDRPGVTLMELDDQIRRDLNAADALLLLMDSEDEEQKLASDLDKVLSTLHMAVNRGTARDPRPVSICLTKADRLLSTVEDLELATGDPSRFVRDHISNKLEAVASRFLTTYRCFPVSAAGVIVRDGIVEPLTFYDEALKRRLSSGGKPVNLLAPFLWAAEQLSAGVSS